jgi:23S rRNA (pseudouridine1915-N3)-methyltransferase
MLIVTSFGEVSSPWREQLITQTKRLIPFDWREIPLKRCPDQRTPQLLPEEKKFLEKEASFVLVDVSGRSFTSHELSRWMLGSESRHLVIGPAIGFHPEFFARASAKISLSSLTLTHQLAHVVLAESIYRSACILKNHPFVK